MQMKKCSNNGGFADVKLSLFNGSQLLTLEPNSFSSFTNDTSRKSTLKKIATSRKEKRNLYITRMVCDRVRLFVNEHPNIKSLFILLYYVKKSIME